jgi:hypothetical protein
VGSTDNATIVAAPSPASGSGSTTSSGTFGVQALVTQVSSNQAQPLAQQATVVTLVNQSTAAPPSLGQSLPQQPQNASSRGLSFGETTEPNLLDEGATGVPSPAAAEPAAPAPEQNTAPAPEQNTAPAPGQMPVEEAPAVPSAPAPDEPVDDPATSLRHEALGQIGLSMAVRRLELPSGPASEPEQRTERLSERSLATLAGAAALAVGSYRVLFGRSDRIKRRWTRGRFI